MFPELNSRLRAALPAAEAGIGQACSHTMMSWEPVKLLVYGSKRATSIACIYIWTRAIREAQALGASKIESKERRAEEGGLGPGAQLPPPWGEALAWIGSRSAPWRGSAYIHQCCIDVVAGFSIHRDEEGEAAVQRQDIHASILIMVSGQEPDAAVLGPDTGCHDVEGLWVQRGIDRHSSDGCSEKRNVQTP